MSYLDKIVSTIPLEKIWTSSNALDSKRSFYLKANDIKTLLTQSKVNFVVANVGDKLKWVDPDDCFSFWKSEIQKHIADKTDRIDLDQFPDNYAYLASLWTSDSQPIILLEKIH